MYKLSSDNGMASFKYVMFVSSHQDAYVPHDSARCQISAAAVQKDQTQGGTYSVMANNVLNNLEKCEKLYRLEVDFKIEGANFDSMIGRTAHIQLLESNTLMRVLIHKYENIFCE